MATGDCSAASPEQVDLINATFSDPQATVTNTQQLTGNGGLVYIGGDIMSGDEVVAHSAVWVYTKGAMSPLSGSAERESSISRSGSDITDANAGDDWGTAVQECVQAS